MGGNNSLATLSGRDNRLVAFRARDGEQVTVTPPGGGTGGRRPIMVNINVSGVRDVDGFNRSQSQIMARTRAALERANLRDN